MESTARHLSGYGGAARRAKEAAAETADVHNALAAVDGAALEQTKSQIAALQAGRGRVPA